MFRHPLRLSLLLAALGILASSAEARPPNILFIFADDLGWRDVGYQGSDFHETPNMDRLAKDGMTFTSGYATAGNCTPSRACLLSGQCTPRHGVYAVGSTDRGPRSLMRLVPIPNTSGLPADNVTMADALKAAGYATGIFGKWHLDGRDGASPEEQGFDVVKRSAAGQRINEPEDPKEIFAITSAACDFMAANKDRPFFAYVPHYAIHTQLQARPETLKRFQEKQPGKQHNDPLYAACLAELDTGVGMLLAKLKELGLEENTLVVFTSDNGGTQRSSQEPLRGNKGSYYEGGVREPFLVRWPGVVVAGSQCDVPVINVDLYPTFLAAAGAETPEGKTLDGESLLPLLKGEGNLRREAIFWHFPGYLDNPVIRGRDPVFRTRPTSVIRKGDWKLHLYHEEWQLDGGHEQLATNRAVELYNLADDIGERNDLALKDTANRDELLGDLLAWHKATGALLPTEKNPNYDPDKPLPAKKGKKKKKAKRGAEAGSRARNQAMD